MELDPTDTAPNNGQAGNGGGGGTSFIAATVHGGHQGVADVAGDGYVLFLTSTDEVRTTDFGFTGGEQTFCVPDGVDQLFAEVQGGAGAGGGPDFPGVGTGGSASGIRAVLSVNERRLLRVAVGGYGGAQGGWGDGHGGSRGDGEDAVVKDGAGGGGSSAIQESSTRCGTSELSGLSDLIVAGGGGGGGGNGFFADGGRGGSGGLDAGDGEDGDNPNGGPGGGGGDAGDRAGGDGTDSTTGGGGGGGGGGLNGGGTGHAPHDGDTGGGGGGGGGRSFVASSAGSVSTYLGPNGDQSSEGDGHVRLVVPVPSTRSAVTVVSGSEQIAFPGQNFAQPVVFRYVDALSDAPVANIPIRMSVVSDGPVPATLESSAPGESVVLSTDASGEVEVFLRAQEGVPVASYVVRAERDDDPAHLIGVAEARVYNVGWPTAMTLTSDEGTQPSDGATPSYTATVSSPSDGGSAVTEGTVQFSVDGVALGGPVPVDAGGVSVSDNAPPLAPGPHHILANYTDASGQHSATFTSLGQSVRPSVITLLSLSSSAADPVEGDLVTFTAALTSSVDVGSYGGTVTFAVNGADVTSPVFVEPDGTASSGPIELPFPADLGVGGAQLFDVSARYSGEALHLPSTASMSQSMRWATDLAASASPIIAHQGQGITVTGEILGTWPAALYPAHTGTMQLFLGAEALTEPFPFTGALTATSPTVSTLTAGIHEITLVYSGDANYGPATSDTIHVIVLPFDLSDPSIANPQPDDGSRTGTAPDARTPASEKNAELPATGSEPLTLAPLALLLLSLGLVLSRRVRRKRPS
ncbi:hypothetical protein ASF96_09195 [Microbacterium sp. Leaf179]|nr:hypothetical protein ASF96_09195 [Microbacterium sp. Leaf179]